MLLAAKDIFCIQRYEIFHEIPNSGGDFSTNGPEKGFRGADCGPSGEVSGAQPGEGQRVQRRGTGAGRGGVNDAAGAGPACSAVGPGAGRGRDGVFCGGARGTKKNGPRSVHFYSTTLLPYGLPSRDTRPMPPAAQQRLRTPGARLFCGRLSAACPPATACLPSISVCQSVGVSAARRPGCPRESPRHQGLSRSPSGSQPLAGRDAPVKDTRRPGLSSQPVGSQQLSHPGHPRCSPPAVRGHSTTTSVWPSTCSWRISCVELT